MSLPHDTQPTSSTTSIDRRGTTRSPSPKIAFVSANFPAHSRSTAPGQAVQNITRQVIRRLSSLQHVEVLEMPNENEHDDDELLSGRDTPSTASPPREGSPEYTNGVDHQTNGRVANGNGKVQVPAKKIDWEIPRKVLHSSIGFLTLYLWTSQGSPKAVVVVLWTAFAVILPADFIRLRWPAFERTYERLLGFLMRECEKDSVNGVVWYILGVNFALTAYPLDVATVAILILSWADTAASTVGRMFGSVTPRLPSRLPFLRLPLAPRKSLAGFVAACVTGTLIAIGFWKWIAPLRHDTQDISWTWDNGVSPALVSPAVKDWCQGLLGGPCSLGNVTSGWVGLGLIGVMAGLVSGVAEALDLGSLDDNLTLPIVAGGCILGSLKLMSLLS
ncbi:hypothetical protein PC9H_000406 [Pleurotus ostreatus]|uniref:Phosphatidate cytidylyltransferase n=1 Tax=Pleurotus ostreatus TaxID=5322 RepID=A0A8H7A3I0_PLEOS|nr:uncharacterized protein PC9H_000406 [Pleurotus ostreatus]KAF7440064.1 hypothetical protein PC9H_000406 [Pleurotus ostreatus]KAJ8700690.1 Diacylglycerol kinase [Pleurotus ostreatus]